jgi:AcrR family transcriptional regulator
MVASCAERGYEATTVAELIALAGVSRRDFYKHFADREACFLATLEEILESSRAVAASRLRRDGSVEERARNALDAILSLLVAQPAAARLCLVDAYAAGEAATQRVDSAIDAYRQLLEQALLEHSPERKMPAELSGAMIGGLRKIVHTRLHRGTEAELPAMVPVLVELALRYRAPPTPLRTPRDGADTQSGGARIDRDPAERIVKATMAIVAAEGYAATTIADVADVAGVSLSTFYAHFDGKAEAFDAALYQGRTKLLGAAMPGFRRARSWPEAIRSVIQASVAFLATEPEFAHLATVDVYAAGPDALERRDRALEAMQRPIDIGVEEYAPGMEAIAREAIISAGYAMLCEWVRSNGPESLPRMGPLATYLTLCPFLGPEEACAVANGGARR